MKLKLLPALIAIASSSAFALEGQIFDSNGDAVAGALVEIVDKRMSVVADEKGYFKLDEDHIDELHVTAPGYAHKTFHIHGETFDGVKKFVLTESVIEQVDVIGIPMHASITESAIPVNVLTGDELRNKQAATLGDSLSNEVGIHTSFHANVASTPVIRGLSGPRVLITQNGLDASDVSRVGPDHSVATEVSTAQQLEVLRGPATLFYGSGAIGGVVNIIDKRVPTETETTGEWMLSHDTVNDQDLISGNLNTGAGDFAFHLDAFIRDANDYEIPVAPELEEEHDEEEDHEDEHGDERSVENSAEESSGFTLGTSYILDNGYVGLSYGRFDREYGIPGHGHSEEEEHDELEEELEDDHEEEEEEVTLEMKQDRFQLISELNLDGSLINAVNTRIGYTDYTHTEFENGSPGTTFSNETSELRVELLHAPQADWHGGFVFDYKNSEFSAEGEEAFAPASTTDSFGIALLEEKHFGDVLLQLGARVEHVTIESNDVTNHAEVEFHHADEEHEEEEEHEDEEHEEEFFVFDESYTPFSVSAGIVWDYAPGYNVGLSFSHAERAPSAAELLSFGPHLGSGFFEAGAFFELHEEVNDEGEEEIHFDPIEGTPEMETSNNIDLTFRKFEGNVGFVVNAFYNQVDNFYAQFDTGLIAEFSHDHDEEEEVEDEAEEEHEHGEELPVLIFRSADATLTGFEAQGIWQVNKNLKTTVYSDYVRAELDDDGNLPRIPPTRFGASIEYEFEAWSANLSWTQYRDQDRVADLETETEGYNWFDANVNYRIPFGASELTLFLKGENLTNEEARVHSSFLKDLAPRPGRNLRIGIRGTF